MDRESRADRVSRIPDTVRLVFSIVIVDPGARSSCMAREGPTTTSLRTGSAVGHSPSGLRGV